MPINRHDYSVFTLQTAVTKEQTLLIDTEKKRERLREETFRRATLGYNTPRKTSFTHLYIAAAQE